MISDLDLLLNYDREEDPEGYESLKSKIESQLEELGFLKKSDTIEKAKKYDEYHYNQKCTEGVYDHSYIRKLQAQSDELYKKSKETSDLESQIKELKNSLIESKHIESQSSAVERTLEQEIKTLKNQVFERGQIIGRLHIQLEQYKSVVDEIKELSKSPSDYFMKRGSNSIYTFDKCWIELKQILSKLGDKE